MKEEEFREIWLQIKKTEKCLNDLKQILDGYKLERENGRPYPNGEPPYNKRKEIDWSLVRKRRIYNYSWRKIADEVGVCHTTLINRARKLGMTINVHERSGGR